MFLCYVQMQEVKVTTLCQNPKAFENDYIFRPLTIDFMKNRNQETFGIDSSFFWLSLYRSFYLPQLFIYNTTSKKVSNIRIWSMCIYFIICTVIDKLMWKQNHNSLICKILGQKAKSGLLNKQEIVSRTTYCFEPLVAFLLRRMYFKFYCNFIY